MTTDTCTCRPEELADPATMLRSAAAQGAMKAGRSYLVATDLSGAVISTCVLPVEAEGLRESWLIASRFIGPAARGLVGDDVVVPPTVVLHLVRCRNGRAVWGRDELAYAYGLLDGLNLVSAFCGEVVVVTPYGWTTGDLCGSAHPTLAELS